LSSSTVRVLSSQKKYKTFFTFSHLSCQSQDTKSKATNSLCQQRSYFLNRPIISDASSAGHGGGSSSSSVVAVRRTAWTRRTRKRTRHRVGHEEEQQHSSQQRWSSSGRQQQGNNVGSWYYYCCCIEEKEEEKVVPIDSVFCHRPVGGVDVAPNVLCWQTASC